VAGGGTAFTTLTGSARAAEVAKDFFPAAGVTLAADVFLGEAANLASVTFLVGSFEPAPVAFFPPGVFAIAIAFSPLPGKPLKKQTARNLLL
jgi:hypothetical protein